MIVLLTAIIFFFIGRYSHSDFKEIREKVERLTMPKPGRLIRPTAKQLKKDTVLEETEKAMEKTLDEIL